MKWMMAACGLSLATGMLFGLGSMARAGSSQEVTPQKFSLAVGKQKTVTIPFAIGQSVNSNPTVISTAVDVEKKTVTFTGSKPGIASYSVFQAGNDQTRVEYELTITAADPAPAK